jgi:hypothetical protein
MAAEICATESPALIRRDGMTHPSACHFAPAPMFKGSQT